jgi:hypothetical protein
MRFENPLEKTHPAGFMAEAGLLEKATEDVSVLEY